MAAILSGGDVPIPARGPPWQSELTGQQAKSWRPLCFFGHDAQIAKAHLAYVNATPNFGDHPSVINGASDLFIKVFGEKGGRARSAVGMGSLPFGAAVEVEAIFEVNAGS